MLSSSLAQKFLSLFRFLVTFCSFQMIKTFCDILPGYDMLHLVIEGSR